MLSWKALAGTVVDVSSATPKLVLFKKTDDGFSWRPLVATGTTRVEKARGRMMRAGP
jgi:hypothetical protein